MSGKIICDHQGTKTAPLSKRGYSADGKRTWVRVGFECLACGALLRGRPRE